jgi:hypothetical protein
MIELLNIGGGSLGVCRVSRYVDAGRGVEVLYVDHADPACEVTDELLTEIQGQPSEWAWLDMPDRQRSSSEDRFIDALVHAMRTRDPIDFELALLDLRANYDDDAPDEPYQDALLHINGVNRHVVYRIGRRILDRNNWEMSWPD